MASQVCTWVRFILSAVEERVRSCLHAVSAAGSHFAVASRRARLLFTDMPSHVEVAARNRENMICVGTLYDAGFFDSR